MFEVPSIDKATEFRTLACLPFLLLKSNPFKSKASIALDGDYYGGLEKRPRFGGTDS